MGAAAAIRTHHSDATIVLLTTRPYAALMRQAPYFDEIWVDERPRDPRGLWRLARLLRVKLEAQGFQVYQHRRVSPGDGGLSYGQVAAAAVRLKQAGLP